jgi:hypothetical protein
MRRAGALLTGAMGAAAALWWRRRTARPSPETRAEEAEAPAPAAAPARAEARAPEPDTGRPPAAPSLTDLDDFRRRVHERGRAAVEKMRGPDESD